MWNIANGNEILVWKYGTIIISQSEPTLPTPHSVLIACPPFEENADIVIDATEQTKTLPTVQNIIKQMHQKQVTKFSNVLIKGGGCLLDMAGFACSIYMRGINKVIFMPTTFLAIADSTVGGKNGVNCFQLKNFIGTIAHPSQIWVNIQYLYTLSKRDFANGMAQTIKMAITHDKELFQWLQNQQINLQKLQNPDHKELLKHVIKKSLQIKTGVVEGDQFDKNSRKWLNFGHSVGHAIQLNQQNDLKHGECVAIGMIEQLKIAVEMGHMKDYAILDRVKNILKKYELPTQVPTTINRNQIIKAMTSDKKNKHRDRIEFAMIEDLGIPKSKMTSIQPEVIKQIWNKGIKISIPDPSLFQQKAKQLNQSWNDRFPSSKSLSIRYLFLSALYMLKTNRSIQITNFLSSQDTQYLKNSLKQLGFQIKEDKFNKTIQITAYNRKSQGELNVGNSGLTARFILPLCCYLPGKWYLNCHKRMSDRPNQSIIQFCSQNFDCQFTFALKNNCFPFQIKTKGLKGQISQLSMNSTQSSQFISSILLNSCLFEQQVTILTNKDRVSESFIQMTLSCLQNFGFQVESYQDKIKINAKDPFQQRISTLSIEKDLSSLSYPYAFSIMHKLPLPSLPSKSTQGDKLFYEYCSELLAQKKQRYWFDFNNCTDTFMTMAALAATEIFSKQINIMNIQNQRVKESDRIEMIRKNLQKIGLFIHEHNEINGITIKPKLNHKLLIDLKSVVFETAGDHRIAMSMGILASYLVKKYPHIQFIIDDKKAVNKTFPQFWKYLADAGVKVSDQISNRQVRNKSYQISTNHFKLNNKIILIGNRGCGKSSCGKMLADKIGGVFIDLDQRIKEDILAQMQLLNISDCVTYQGWNKFRELERDALNRAVAQSHDAYGDKPMIIATGGGIVQLQENRVKLKRCSQSIPIIYLEKQFEDLDKTLNEDRPHINSFRQVSEWRQKHYQDISNYIITLPSHYRDKSGTHRVDKEKHFSFIQRELQRILNNTPLQSLNPGYILCWKTLLTYHHMKDQLLDYDSKQFEQVHSYHQNLYYPEITPEELHEVNAVELRLDEVLHYMPKMSQKQLRFHIAKFKMANSHLTHLPLILTLRSQEQYGRFTGNYVQQMKNIHKIPTDYLDHQVKYPINFPYDQQKLIHSYHGHSQHFIQYLINKAVGNKKLCFDGNPLPFSEFQALKNNFDICVDLNNPITRIKNKHQMVLPSKMMNKITGTGIGTIAEMKALRKLLHLFK